MSTRVIQTLLCLLLALAGAHFSSGRTLERKPLIYDGYRLYQIHLLNEAGNNSVASVALATQHLAELRSSNDDLIFLEDVFMATTIVHVIVAPHMVPAFELQLKQSTMSWELLSANYKELLDNDAQQDVSVSDNYDWVSYYKLNDTYNFLNRLQKKYPRVVHRFEIGKSAEGRPIIGVHVSKPDNRRKTRSSEIQGGFFNPGNDNGLDPGTAVGMFTIQRIYEAITQTRSKKKAKPTIFVEAGMHGNQWITSAVATYIINELATSTEPAVVMAAKRYNWIILPHANPDGYVYTDKSDRLWSKSRSKHSGCIGVDLNRNFYHGWQAFNSILPPKCNKFYRGPNDLSEPETKALAHVMNAGAGNIKLYIALHLNQRNVKFTYDVGKAPNANLLDEIYQEASRIMLNRGAYLFRGASADYAWRLARIPATYNYFIGDESDIVNKLIPGLQVPETAIAWLARDTFFNLITLADKNVPIETDQNNPPLGLHH